MTDMHPSAARLIDPEGRPQSILLASQRDKIRAALERAHHSLATLHGGTVYDGDAEEGEVIDETETLAAIDGALRLVSDPPTA